MLSYRDGDAHAFEVLYLRHKGGLYRYFLRQTGNRGLAEELYQDVWMRVVRARERYEVRAKFTTYLYHLAHNRLIDHYRRKNPEISLSYEDDEAGWESLPAAAHHAPDEQVERQRMVQRFKEALETLPAAQREAFLLREEGGLGLDDIAETMGVNRETAKSRLRYALSKLRKQLAEGED